MSTGKLICNLQVLCKFKTTTPLPLSSPHPTLQPKKIKEERKKERGKTPKEPIKKFKKREKKKFGLDSYHEKGQRSTKKHKQATAANMP